jgi:type I restriction enzyme R subunit
MTDYSIDPNQNPEQLARDVIDQQLLEAGWVIQNVNQTNLAANAEHKNGVAVREFPTNAGPADYMLFVDGVAYGVIEAKKAEMGEKLSVVEEQSLGYAKAGTKYQNTEDTIRFLYESTGILTKFSDLNDINYSSRKVFRFHQPEELYRIVSQADTIRNSLKNELPKLEMGGFRDCQLQAIEGLEKSLSQNKSRALIQMATGAGKTLTAISEVYRLLKFAGAKRILWLVDTKNLGKQAHEEFQAYIPHNFFPVEDNRNFTDLYQVNRLQHSAINKDSQVVISTIQRMYSILKGEELDEANEDENPDDLEQVFKKTETPVEYNAQYPPEFFDFIIIDECHRSIYNIWQQVLDYFDAFQIGLTATPDKKTFAYFNKNVVSEYSHEQAVIDGVNVPGDVFVIKTNITEKGGTILEPLKQIRERKTRAERWVEDDEILTYESAQLDKSVVALDQIRTVLQAFKDNLPQMFPDRYSPVRTQDPEVPKTLIFAKTDSHADDIINMVKEVFGKGNEFCKKITYKADKADQALTDLRTDANLRIAVTVSMIATGTDVKPLECLLFMRDVKSKNYFEQMRGRGTRTHGVDELRKVTPSALHNKDRFILVDAVGVTESKKIDSRPLDRNPSVSLKELMMTVAMGNKTSDILTTLAGRLIRLDKMLDYADREQIQEKSDDVALKEIARNLLNAFDEDFKESELEGSEEKLQEFLVEAVKPFNNPEFRDVICQIKQNHEQYIDYNAIDVVKVADWQTTTKEQASEIITKFTDFINQNKDRIDALQLIFSHDFKNRQLVYNSVETLYDEIKKAGFSNEQLWNAHFTLGNTDKKAPELQLADIIQIIRFTLDGQPPLTTFGDSVRVKYRDWIMAKNHEKGQGHITNEQNDWLSTIRDQIITSVSISQDDFNLGKLREMGGIGKFYELFGENYVELLKEMNSELVA